MKDLIFIAGAPGVGKSSIARQLQKKLGSPCFEFGWIPEFRQKGNETITYKEEESIAFENLVLVAKNYVKHGFSNIIITDLEDVRITQLHNHFENYNYVLFTLTVADDGLLKSRILNEDRSSEYRDWVAGLAMNKKILSRKLLLHEVRIDTTNKSIPAIAEEMKPTPRQAARYLGGFVTGGVGSADFLIGVSSLAAKPRGIHLNAIKEYL